MPRCTRVAAFARNSAECSVECVVLAFLLCAVFGWVDTGLTHRDSVRNASTAHWGNHTLWRWLQNTSDPKVPLGPIASVLAEVNVLDQQWTMFYEAMPEDYANVWFSFPAELADGHKVDLAKQPLFGYNRGRNSCSGFFFHAVTDQAAVNLEPPINITDAPGSVCEKRDEGVCDNRWTNSADLLVNPDALSLALQVPGSYWYDALDEVDQDDSGQLDALVQYLCRQWNAIHAGTGLALRAAGMVRWEDELVDHSFGAKVVSVQLQPWLDWAALARLYEVDALDFGTVSCRSDKR